MTIKTLLPLFIALLYIPGLQAQQKENQGYETVKDMPLFYEQMKACLTYPLAWQNNRNKAFDSWRQEAKEALYQCLSPATPEADFQMEVTDTKQRDGYKVQKICFNLSGFSRVPAYLLIPDGKGPFPAIVMYHDHGAHFSIGKEKMVRPFHVPDTLLSDAEEWSVKCYDGQYTGDYYARNGYVVLSVDALFWGDRGRKEGVRYDSQQALSANLLQMGMSWGALIAWDDIRSVDFIATQPYVDAEKIGVLGFSMGAHRAWMTAAASEKVKAAAAICWMNTTDSLMSLTNNQNKGGSAYSMIIPNLRNYMDYPHVASIACPKPMFFINGTRDKLFPVEGVKEAYRQMHEVWDSQQAGDKLLTKLYDSPHFFSKEMQEETLRFFNKWFNK